MAEPKMISPMLDNFIMGSSMSEHHGVRCYPAIENGSGDRYIVKVVSVPAAASQLDALLLTGAYSDRSAALDYFKEMADGVVQEADTLEKLAELEGFVGFTACQVEPMESGDGYDIYLLSPYKRTLQNHFTRHSFTHLDALNLGLDLCAALSVCRRSGYLYIDLKPSNIYVTDQRLFRIGDLGFMRLDSLKYASVPEKYLSVYTPPEIRDAFSALNSTMDVYAAGLILYQTYNNGELPFNDDVQPGDRLPAPLYADYEMSEIILKACAPDPEDRWQDPTEMGQAIISYMQRNGAMDTPIVPMPEPEPVTEQTDAMTVKDEPESEETVQADIPSEEPVEDTDIAEYSVEAEETDTSEETDIDDDADVVEDANTADVADESEDADTADDTDESEDADTADDTDKSEDADTADDAAIQEDNENLAFLDDEDDEAIIEEAEDYDTLTDEVSEMLNQADELAAMDVPEPVVVPDHVDVPMPEPPEPEEPQEEDADNNSDEEAADPETEDEDISSDSEELIEFEESEVSTVIPRKKGHWIRNAILILLLLALLAGGYFFYKHYYLLPVDFIAVEGNMDTLTVYVTTEIDESLLKVVCSDTYGIKLTAPVVNGKAEFTDLVPNTAYSIKVIANGFHRLTGNASTAYSTPVQSNIVQFDAVTGTTEDSVILSFTVEGPNCDEWTVLYSAEGEEERSATFSSHMVTLTNLTVGKDYTLRLVPSDDLYVTGQSEIVFTARKLVKAENLRVTGCVNSTLTAQWDMPEGETVSSWSVHCFNDTYNQTIITSDTTATFKDLDHTAEYTVEVKAVGMSVSQTARVSANSITASNFTTDISDPTKISFTWEPSQSISEDGWLLRYSVTGIDNEVTIPCSTNSAVIYPVIPNATYRVRLEDIKGNVLLGSETVIKTGEPVEFSKEFDQFTATNADLEFTICRTPKNPSWGRYDLSASDYTSNFTVGQNASYLVRFQKLYNAPDEEVTVMYVIRSEDGTPIHSAVQSNTWKDMWTTTYCKLNVPTLPSIAGTYTMDIYFNGGLVHEQTFTVSQ